MANFTEYDLNLAEVVCDIGDFLKSKNIVDKLAPEHLSDLEILIGKKFQIHRNDKYKSIDNTFDKMLIGEEFNTSLYTAKKVTRGHYAIIDYPYRPELVGTVFHYTELINVGIAE